MNSQEITLLVIDDDEDQLLLFDMLLKKAGYSVITTNSAEQGLEILISQSVDLVICDMLMPSMDGQGFVAELRQRPAVADTPVILLTAARDDLEWPALEGGANGFCLKREASTTLLAQIQAIFQK